MVDIPSKTSGAIRRLLPANTKEAYEAAKNHKLTRQNHLLQLCKYVLAIPSKTPITNMLCA